MPRHLPSLRSRLILLVLCPLLPALAFAGWLLAREYQQDLRETEQTAALATRALSLAVDQKIAAAEAALRGLGSSSALGAGRLEEFHAEASAVARATGLRNILLVGPAGEHVLNTLKPWGTPLPVVMLDPGWRRVFREGGVVSRLAPSVLTGQSVVVVAVPVGVGPRGGSWGLGAVLRREDFQAVLHPAGLPSNWVVSILDTDQVVVARSVDPELFVGKPPSAMLRNAMASAPMRSQGFFDNVALDGRRMHTLYSRAPRHGWTVAVSVPRGSIGEPVSQSVALLAGLALAMVAAGLAMDIWLGRRLGRDVDALVQQSDRLGSGEPARASGLQFDEAERIATAIGQAGTRLARAREALERKNEDLREFAYSAAHDLHTPLRTVRSLLDVLRDRHATALGSEGGDLLGRAGQAVDRLHRMTRDLLMFATVDRPEDSFSGVDLRALAAEALALLQDEIDAVGAEVELGALPTVRGDASQLLQLMLNLLSNALRFRSAAPCRVRIGAAPGDAGQWRVWVMDNGVGIAPQQREQVFGLFKRLGPGSHLPGTGIGLALCRRIVERHGGRIWVESRPGQGSTFFFTIPAGDDHAGDPAV